MFTMFFESALSVGLLVASNLLAAHASAIPRASLHYQRSPGPRTASPSVEFAGASCEGQNGSFYSVAATIKVPNLTGVSGNTGSSLVVLGDSSTSDQTLLLAGIGFTIDANNQTVYYVQYGNNTDDLQLLSGSDYGVLPGADIQFTLEQTASSSYEDGKITVSNLDNGLSSSYSFVSKSNPPISGETARLTVLEYPSIDLPTGTVIFKDVSTGPTRCDLGQSMIQNIDNQEGEPVTEVSTTSSSVTIKFGDVAIHG